MDVRDTAKPPDQSKSIQTSQFGLRQLVAAFAGAERPTARQRSIAAKTIELSKN